MKITEKTYVSDILKEYGDIAEIMEIFGIKRVGGYGFRKFITRFITVKIAAFVHGIPLEKFIKMLKVGIDKKEANN
jgi:virulence-associated protein VapD